MLTSVEASTKPELNTRGNEYTSREGNANRFTGLKVISALEYFPVGIYDSFLFGSASLRDHKLDVGVERVVEECTNTLQITLRDGLCRCGWRLYWRLRRRCDCTYNQERIRLYDWIRMIIDMISSSKLGPVEKL